MASASRCPPDPRLRPWSGIAYRHIPTAYARDIRDFRYAGRGADNRWNEPGEPTLYLAGDLGVLISEWGRHFEVDRSPGLRARTRPRTVFRFAITLARVIDARSADLWADLGLTNAPSCFLDRGIARAVARLLRSTTDADGLLVPPVALLDQPDRWNLVVFLDRAAAGFITSCAEEGPLLGP